MRSWPGFLKKPGLAEHARRRITFVLRGAWKHDGDRLIAAPTAAP
ncbi:hypothetical protein [Pikeienuella piscinae]|nr:hypothetical protein [Pikeienuella piscinae]